MSEETPMPRTSCDVCASVGHPCPDCREPCEKCRSWSAHCPDCAAAGRAAATPDRDTDGTRLYNLLALWDTSDGSPLSDLVRSAREGFERSHPDMAEDDAWREFDALWERSSSADRLRWAKAAADEPKATA